MRSSTRRPIETRPYKDGAYLTRRRFEHPVYRYRMLGYAHRTQEGADGVYIARGVIWRREVLRIVDYIEGRRAIARSGGALERYMRERDVHELLLGSDHEALEAGGFVLRRKTTPMSCPTISSLSSSATSTSFLFDRRRKRGLQGRRRPGPAQHLPEGFADE